MGLGFYFRNTTEHLLLAVKGKLMTKSTDILTYFEAPRGRHSAKPDKAYEIIKKASHPPYGEYHSRKKREGWIELS